MASFDLSWTPASGINSTGQQVQYKESVSSTWLVAATLSGTADSYTVDDLDDNVVYDFRISNLCSLGGPTPGASFQVVGFVQPDVTITPTYNSVTFSFTHVGGSVSSYRMDLLNSSGSTILAFRNIPSPSGMVSNSFTGLSANSNYNLRLTMKVGTSYSDVGDLLPFTSTDLPACSMPSDLVVAFLEESDSDEGGGGGE
jgi:hypothetical protein